MVGGWLVGWYGVSVWVRHGVCDGVGGMAVAGMGWMNGLTVFWFKLSERELVKRVFVLFIVCLDVRVKHNNLWWVCWV